MVGRYSAINASCVYSLRMTAGEEVWVHITILIGYLLHSWVVLLRDCWWCNAVRNAVWSSERI